MTTTTSSFASHARMGKLAIALTANLAAPKHHDAYLHWGQISPADIHGDAALISAPAYPGLSVYEKRVIHAVALCLPGLEDDADVRHNLQQLSLGLAPYDRQQRTSAYHHVYRTLDLRPVARLLHGSARTKCVGTLLSALRAISQKRFIVTVTSADHSHRLTWETALFRVCEENAASLTLEVGLAFYANLANNHAFLPYAFFAVWGKRGSGTESDLFCVLMDDLLTNFRNHYAAYKKSHATRADSPVLVHRELLSTLLGKVSSGYSPTKSRPQRVMDVLGKAVGALIRDLKLITKCEQVPTPNGLRLDFYFNMAYTH